MKIHIDIDCTPDEARSFFGLPDVKPLQNIVMSELQERMTSGIKAVDLESMMKLWMPGGILGLDKMQQLLWPHVMGGKPSE
ncbi:MAG: DUF6489 family protein [Alphaproteobacteria bacterium]